MSLDPTLEEMETFLRQKTAGLLDWTEYATHFEMKIAVHYFATHHYSGQFSNLYQAICRIDYDSKEMEVDDEGSDVNMMYQFLTNKYTK